MCEFIKIIRTAYSLLPDGEQIQHGAGMSTLILEACENVKMDIWKQSVGMKLEKGSCFRIFKILTKGKKRDVAN